MFNLMSNCCTWVSKIQEPIRKMTILVVGLDKAGKTSCIRGMLRAGPTQGCIRNELRVENYLVTLLDVGGSAESRGTWRELYREAHGIIFVVDSSDRQRIKEVKGVLADLLKQPRVAGKPILVLANKQDKMNALLGNELIEILSLEKLVNQSRSLCHIEPCSALMDLRRWSDRKTLRGLRWLLRAVCLDYPELCTRVAQDSKRPLEPREKEKTWKTEKVRKKNKGERKSDLRQVHRPKDKEKPKSEGKLQPIRNMLQKETTLKKKLKSKKKKKLVKVKKGEKDHEEGNEQQDEEEGDSQEGEQENAVHREKASSALIPPKKGQPKRQREVKKETLDMPESPDNDEKELKAKGEKRRKKKVVKVKRKNKINTEEMPGDYSQSVDLSSTFDLYRKAILALKERQDQGQ
ncbi:ADP-ribosylation factor-like protein 13A [Micropterus dolomieu]|uniref:ADP-ribosylation factor-like protein 13A n=1 Tax=Micropterus dolomieu TaxID=147949 RepID=UPI001E8D12F9|nr:ADP-ribosylation factor-like protein 13A [Micropterus dolomieu]